MYYYIYITDKMKSHIYDLLNLSMFNTDLLTNGLEKDLKSVLLLKNPCISIYY